MLIENLTDDDKGRDVVYKANSLMEKEFGYITSWNKNWIFVCFDQTTRGKACNPSHVEFKTKKKIIKT